MLQPSRWQVSIRSLMGLVLASACLLAAWPVLLRQYTQRGVVCRVYCASHIRQIGLALLEYHTQNGCFPPAYVADPQGKPLYSWRVLILPYIDQSDLYNAYNLGQPWDGPENLRISDTNIKLFTCPEARDWTPRSFSTNYVAVTGPGTAFVPGQTTKSADVRDGPATLLLTETIGSGIHWAEPRDLDVATMSLRINDPTRPSISSHDESGPRVMLMDGTVRAIPPSSKAATIRSLITIRGGEKVDIEDFNR